MRRGSTAFSRCSIACRMELIFVSSSSHLGLAAGCEHPRQQPKACTKLQIIYYHGLIFPAIEISVNKTKSHRIRRQRADAELLQAFNFAESMPFAKLRSDADEDAGVFESRVHQRGCTVSVPCSAACRAIALSARSHGLVGRDLLASTTLSSTSCTFCRCRRGTGRCGRSPSACRSRRRRPLDPRLRPAGGRAAHFLMSRE